MTDGQSLGDDITRLLQDEEFQSLDVQSISFGENKDQPQFDQFQTSPMNRSIQAPSIKQQNNSQNLSQKIQPFSNSQSLNQLKLYQNQEIALSSCQLERSDINCNKRVCIADYANSNQIQPKSYLQAHFSRSSGLSTNTHIMNPTINFTYLTYSYMQQAHSCNQNLLRIQQENSEEVDYLRSQQEDNKSQSKIILEHLNQKEYSKQNKDTSKIIYNCDQFAKKMIRKIIEQQQRSFKLFCNKNSLTLDQIVYALMNYLITQKGIPRELIHIGSQQFKIMKQLYFPLKYKRIDPSFGKQTQKRGMLGRNNFVNKGTRKEAIIFFQNKLSRLIFWQKFKVMSEAFFNGQDAPNVKRCKVFIERLKYKVDSWSI